MKEKIRSFFFILGVLFPIVCQAMVEPGPNSLVFKSSSVLNSLPSKDVQSVYQDRDGYIWISTRNGLFQYDGYSITTYKSNLYCPDLLTNNNIYCVAEDAQHRLWIGTYSGLNVLDKQTGQIRKIDDPEINGIGISQILVTSDNRILFATEGGLLEYLEDSNRFLAFNQDNTDGVFPKTTVKSLFEDDRGDIWIGTWSQGLFRYEKRTGKYRKYPQMNSGNSAHVVFQDSHKNIWVGTWGAGLHLLHDAYNPEKTTWTTFTHDENRSGTISDNLIYAISEDLNTNSLWVGTRSGLSILSLMDIKTGHLEFENCYSGESENSITSSEVASLLRDRQGIMWVGMIGGGINMVNNRKAKFNMDRLSEAKRMLKSNSVRSILLDDEGLLWMGMSTYGFGVKDRATGKFTHYTQMLDFKNYSRMSTVMSIIQSPSTGHIWVGVYNGGAFEIDKSAPVGKRVKYYSPSNVPWMCNSCIYSIYEDSKQNMWFATRGGVSMRTADGTPVRIDSLKVGDTMMYDVVAMQIVEGNNGDMWVTSSTNGVIRIQGSGNSLKEYTVSGYSLANDKLNSNYADCVYKDAQGRIWVGTGGSGLNLYDAANDTFLPVHVLWNLPGDAIASIQSDKQGELWLGTNIGLLRLTVPDDLQNVTYRLYTTADGLQDNIFNRGASCVASDGEMFFGGHRGYNSFYPDQQEEQVFSFPVVITNIKVFNQTWASLTEKERAAMSDLSPGFMNEIRLDYKHNNFSIEFSALEYANPERNQYAYRLEGFDSGWQYTDASKRFAYYNNLKAGTYTFYLKSSNSNGIWNQDVQTVKVIILPPPWKTWWAYTLYILLVLGSAWYAYRVIRNRIRLRNALHMREMEQAKAEEINHAKLQFFTNITHELLTPLTIISATVDELKIQAPKHTDLYVVMNSNIRRLIRLLQQILEFRKAETGNLRLRVSPGDIASFVKNGAESFQPLIKKQKIHFSVLCDPESIIGYFDTDKLDKILYNLLSNAAKYTKEDGFIQVTLSYAENKDWVLLRVKDNGKGISKEKQKTLFRRFYEGDYRKFNTIGTGIGLSLTKDLVELHEGTITVESEEGQGTEFIIRLPIDRSYFREEQIDDEVILPVQKLVAYEEEMDEKQSDEILVTAEKANSILVIEDNEELLHLMTKLLRHEYNVFTAENGKEGIAVLENEDIELIVSDVMMPEMDGMEFCKYVKGKLEISHIPVILLTAKNKEEDRAEAYEVGADAFISKPFNLAVLHARIRNLLKYKERMAHEFKKQLVFELKDLNYTSLDEDFMQRAIDCVNNHLEDCEFDQPQFADEMKTSKSTLYKKLKSLTGLNTSAFIRNVRLKSACRIMEEKGNSIRISELAYAVGFNDPKYFSACFKKEFGVLPSEYLDQFVVEKEHE